MSARPPPEPQLRSQLTPREYSVIFGYTLLPGLYDDELAKGPDHGYDTRDDLVHAAVIQFLKRKL